MDVLMSCFCCVYVVIGVAAVVGMVWHPSRRNPHRPHDVLPSVSIIVAIRNEERDLPRCIAALEALDYPQDRLEVLLVDDESTDASATIIANAVTRNPCFRQLSTAGFVSSLRVKARPVDLAARHAVGDWLLITDADGAVHPAWARSLMSAVQPHDGIVCGPFVALPWGLHGRLEALMSAFLMAFCFGLISLRVPSVCQGPNMAIRRRVYAAGGGLPQANVLVAEDVALWRLSHTQGFSTRGLAQPESTVLVTPTASFCALLSQHHRWLGGGLHDGPPPLKFVVAAVAGIAWLASAYTAVGLWHPTAVWATLVTLRAAIDFLLVWALQRRCRVSLPLAWFPLLELYLLVGFLLIPALLCFSRRLAWRGHGYVEILQSASANRP